LKRVLEFMAEERYISAEIKIGHPTREEKK